MNKNPYSIIPLLRHYDIYVYNIILRLKFNEYSTTHHVVSVEGKRVKSGEDGGFLWKIWTNGMETKNKGETVNETYWLHAQNAFNLLNCSDKYV